MVCSVHTVSAQVTPSATTQPDASISLTGEDKNLLDQIQKNLTCGKVGTACCDTFTGIPNLAIAKPSSGLLSNFVVNGLIDGINNDLHVMFQPALDLFVNPLLETILVNQKCQNGTPSNLTDIKSCVCLQKDTANFGSLCLAIKDPAERFACTSKCVDHGVWTALGCVDYNLKDFIQNTVFTLGLGIAGAAAFACIIYSALALQLSRGNPEKIKKAQETLTSCILGLLLIIFSVFILRLIGFSILHIPGFG